MMAGPLLESLQHSLDAAVTLDEDPLAIARLLSSVASVLRQPAQPLDDDLQQRVGRSVVQCLASMRSSPEVRSRRTGRSTHVRELMVSSGSTFQSEQSEPPCLLMPEQVQIEGCYTLAILSHRCSRCADRPPPVSPATSSPAPNLIPRAPLPCHPRPALARLEPGPWDADTEYNELPWRPAPGTLWLMRCSTQACLLTASGA